MPPAFQQICLRYLQDGDHVIHYDTQVRGLGIYRSGICRERFLPARAGGGTFFSRVVEFAILNQFDHMVVVTDGFLSEDLNKLKQDLDGIRTHFLLPSFSYSISDFKQVFGEDDVEIVEE